MADPTKLYQHLPDVYDRSIGSDQYALLFALSVGTENAREAIQDFEGDLTISLADGEGLDRLGENYDVPRSPGMTDTRYRALIRAVLC